MKGDRIKIITGTMYEHADALVYVYGVKLNPDGSPVRGSDGSVLIESLGGVKTGSTGVVVGKPEKAHRVQLKDHEAPVGLSSNDYVTMVPIMLDTYQQLGWFPSENIRVVSGGVAQ